jgi:hypothetical protein
MSGLMRRKKDLFTGEAAVTQILKFLHSRPEPKMQAAERIHACRVAKKLMDQGMFVHAKPEQREFTDSDKCVCRLKVSAAKTKRKTDDEVDNFAKQADANANGAGAPAKRVCFRPDTIKEEEQDESRLNDSTASSGEAGNRSLRSSARKKNSSGGSVKQQQQQQRKPLQTLTQNTPDKQPGSLFKASKQKRAATALHDNDGGGEGNDGENLDNSNYQNYDAAEEDAEEAPQALGFGGGGKPLSRKTAMVRRSSLRGSISRVLRGSFRDSFRSSTRASAKVKVPQAVS